MHPDHLKPRCGLRTLAGAALLLTLTVSGNAFAGPAPVLRGTTEAFAVLGGAGLTNTGLTTIAGDVGSSPTASQTGFGACPAGDCVALTGTNHAGNAVTQQAKVDLVAAYDDAFGRTGGTPITAPLGGGQTLVAGLYTAAVDIFVGGDLTLDGGGDPNAVFIFQAKTGTLRTAAGIAAGIPNTRVLLRNGAQGCNVFWQVGSSATIGTFTQFAGNVLALQSITVDTRATLDSGSALARNGAVTLDTNTITRSACTTPVGAPGPPASGGGGGSGSGSGPGSTPPGGGAPGTTTPGDVGTTPPPGSGPAASPPSSGTLTPTQTTAPTSGTAQISGPRGPVRGPFDVVVTGRGIEAVTFYVDGQQVGTVPAVRGRTKFVKRIDPRRQSRRVHRVTARVRFRPGSQTPTATRRITYRRAGTARRAPRFTG